MKNDIVFKKTILMGNICFSIHFFLMGSFTASGMSVVNGIRNYLSIKQRGSKKLIVIFITMYLVVGFFTFQYWYNIFPIFSSIAATLSVFLLPDIPITIYLSIDKYILDYIRNYRKFVRSNYYRFVCPCCKYIHNYKFEKI